MTAVIAVSLAVLLAGTVNCGDWRNGKTSPQRDPSTLQSANFVQELTLPRRFLSVHSAQMMSVQPVFEQAVPNFKPPPQQCIRMTGPLAARQHVQPCNACFGA